jgi:hypothetical protein
MRSKSSARTSLLAAASLAAYKTLGVRNICPKNLHRVLAKRKIPMPAKIAFAGENTYII